MRLYSTNDSSNIVELKEAVLKSLASDKGLYMPLEMPKLPDHFLNNLAHFTFPEIAFQVSKHLFGTTLSNFDLWEICERAINFPAPVKHLEDKLSTLELFHGPSLAFKDFGARYMAQLMSYFTKDDDKQLTILVATSGDTGGAVAAGFYNTPGIEVIILYPSGRVSHLQEQQLTTLGGNIHACEVEGSFDDCQAMVKAAFIDQDLNKMYNLSSANSINIARLIPQSFYYFEAYKQLAHHDNVVFCVPSGNFGNLTAGLMAKKMGLPVQEFIAATNLNKVVPDYLSTGQYEPMQSVATISNAMDVGAPSNFVRLSKLFRGNLDEIRNNLKGYYFDDQQTRAEIKTLYDTYKYIADPHGAVGFLAAKAYLKTHVDSHVCVLETAHPCKFIDTVEAVLSNKVVIPERLASLQHKTKDAARIENTFSSFKNYLLER